MNDGLRDGLCETSSCCMDQPQTLGAERHVWEGRRREDQLEMNNCSTRQGGDEHGVKVLGHMLHERAKTPSVLQATKRAEMK